MCLMAFQTLSSSRQWPHPFSRWVLGCRCSCKGDAALLALILEALESPSVWFFTVTCFVAKCFSDCFFTHGHSAPSPFEKKIGAYL